MIKLLWFIAINNKNDNCPIPDLEAPGLDPFACEKCQWLSLFEIWQQIWKFDLNMDTGEL